MMVCVCNPSYERGGFWMRAKPPPREQTLNRSPNDMMVCACNPSYERGRSERRAYFSVETAIFGSPEVLERSLGGSGSSPGSLEALRFLSHVKRNNAIPKKKCLW